MNGTNPYSEEDTAKILRQRKKRITTSCFPCRTKKIKCDRSSPCTNCTKKGYTELCSYTDFSVSKSAKPMVSRPTSGQSSSPEAAKAWGSVAETHDRQEPLRSQEYFLGANAVPSFLKDQVNIGEPSPDHEEVFESAVMLLLGLGGSKAAYPFAVLGNSQEKLNEALPSNIEIFRYFECFRFHAHSIVPIMPDIVSFEKELCFFTENRCEVSKTPEQGSFETGNWRSVAWLGTLYAVLAAGLGYSELDKHQIQEKSQLYVRYSFHCLRRANFLVRPSLLCIQTLLLLGNVLQNQNMPESSWMLLGTTSRMAQSLGLHALAADASISGRRLWLSIVRQDSLLSLCFDRYPVCVPTRVPAAIDVEGRNSMPDTMDFICETAVRKNPWTYDAGASLDLEGILEDVLKIERLVSKTIFNTAGVHKSTAKSQSLVLQLHSSFVIAWLCRPVLRGTQNSAQASNLSKKCIAHLMNCARSYVQLQSLTVVASRSWPIIHNGLSSILLLALLGRSNADPETKLLHAEIMAMLSDSDQELSAPHARALAALKKLYAGNEWKGGSAMSVDAHNQIPTTPVINGYDPDLQLYPNMNTSPLYPAFSGINSAFEAFDSIIWDPMTPNEFSTCFDATNDTAIGNWSAENFQTME